MLQAIHEAIARRDADEALALAAQAVAAQPQQADAYHALAVARQFAGDLAGAGAALEQAIQLAPERADLHVARAALAVAQSDKPAADAALAQAVQQDPNRLSAYLLAAHLALAAGKTDEVEQQLKLARRIDPEHPGVLTVEGNLALLGGDHARAISLLTLASQRAPRDSLALTSLGMAFLAADNAAFAEQALRRALQLQPAELRLHWALVESLARQDRIDDLLTALAALLDLAPQNAKAHAMRVHAQLATEAFEDATVSARRWLSSGKLSWAELDVLAGYFLHAGQAERVAPLFDEALQADADQEALWHFRHSMVAHDPARALEVMARWQIAMPASAALLGVMAMDAEQSGRLDEAEQLADRALAAQPGLLSSMLVKLRALLRRDPAALLGFCDEIGAHASSDFGRRLGLLWKGLAHAKLAQYSEAAACWTRVARIAPAGTPFPEPQAWADRGQAEDPEAACLLWGPPGSRLNELTGMLRQVPGLSVIDDRFGAGPRPDGLWPPRQDGQIVDRGGWQRFIRSYGVDPLTAIDVLPHWDGRVDAALGRSRLVAVIADPRDLLLNALVYAGPQTWATPDIDRLAIWLGDTLGALADRVAAWPDQTLLVDAAALWSDPASVAARVQAFLGLPSVPPSQGLQASRQGIEGTPSCFPPGTWRHYAEAFAVPFARLQPLCARLGLDA